MSNFFTQSSSALNQAMLDTDLTSYDPSVLLNRRFRTDASSQSKDEEESLPMSSSILMSPYFDQLSFDEQIALNNYSVPDSYKVLVPFMSSKKLKDFNSSVLFYIFYNFAHDELQIEAYNELLSKGWLYHRKSNLWYIFAVDE